MNRRDIAYFAGVAVGFAGLAIYVLPLFLALLGNDDFATIWVGPRALILGLDPYNAATWSETSARIASGLNPPDTSVYLYPPWVTVALVPLALLPLVVATAVWTVLGMVAAIAAVRALAQTYLPDSDWTHGICGLLITISAPAAVTFVTGQWTFFFVAGLAAIILCLRAERPVAAGLVAVLMLAKPPLFVFSALGLAVRVLWPRAVDRAVGRRFVLVAAGAGALVIAIAWVIVPTWWPAWFYHVAAVQVGITPVTVQTLLVTLFGATGAWLAAAVVVAGTIAALQFDPRGDAWLPVWLALSSAAVIYSNTYDALLIIVPMILAAGVLRQRSPRRSGLVVVTGALLLLPVMWYLHTWPDIRLYAAIVPLTMFAVIAATLWPERHATGRPAESL